MENFEKTDSACVDVQPMELYSKTEYLRELALYIYILSREASESDIE